MPFNQNNHFLISNTGVMYPVVNFLNEQSIIDLKQFKRPKDTYLLKLVKSEAINDNSPIFILGSIFFGNAQSITLCDTMIHSPDPATVASGALFRNNGCVGAFAVSKDISIGIKPNDLVVGQNDFTPIRLPEDPQNNSLIKLFGYKAPNPRF